MAITFRHGKGKTVGANSMEIVTDTVVAGDIIHVSGEWLKSSGDDASTKSLTVTDSGGHTWVPHTARVKTGTGANTEKAQSWHTVVVTPGALTLTLALTGGSGTVTHLIGEYAALIDAHQTTPHLGEHWGQSIGTSASSLSTGSVVVDSEGAMLLSSIMTSNNRTFTDPTGGWTRATATTTEDGSAAHFAYLALSAEGSPNVAWTWTGGSSNGIALLDAYRAAAASGPTYAGTYNVVARDGGLDDGLG